MPRALAVSAARRYDIPSAMAQFKLTVRQLAEKLGGSLEGSGEAALTAVASLDIAGEADVTFVLDERRASLLGECKAGAAIVSRDCPAASIPLIRVDDVLAGLAAALAELAEPEEQPPAGVHPSATVADDARLGEGVAIGPNAVVGARTSLARGTVLCANAAVGADVEIGEETILHPGAVVMGRCRIGRRCRIGPNAVIGSTGFGYFVADGRHNPITHAGTVEIGDDVDIGACACVDRAKFGATRIGDGTKIDNLVQVAHNVQIGRHCAIAALTGIAGSTVIKDNVILGGHVGVRDNITLGAGMKAGAFTAIAQDVPDGMVVAGLPANEAGATLRGWKLIERLPAMRQEMRQLKKRLDALEQSEDH